MKRLILLALLTAGPLLRADEPVKTEITSQSLEMTSTDEETRAIFTGNVEVRGTNIRMSCNRLEIVATRLGGKAEGMTNLERFKSLLATGQVRIVQGSREASCGRAEVFPREDKIILTEGPTVIDHASGSVAVGEPLILFRGERRVMGENIRITFPPIKNLGFNPDGTLKEGEKQKP